MKIKVDLPQALIGPPELIRILKMQPFQALTKLHPDRVEDQQENLVPIQIIKDPLLKVLLIPPLQESRDARKEITVQDLMINPTITI